MPRRHVDYPDAMTRLNAISSALSVLMAVLLVLFAGFALYQVFARLRRGPVA